MPIRYEEIIATVDTSASKPSAETLATERPQTLDNLYLDAYGYVIDELHNHAIGVPSVSMVYAAAKVMFARAADGKLIYDLSGDMGAAGASPWEHICSSPEEWAVCFARRYVETTDGEVEDDAVDADVVGRVRYTLDVLRQAGVPITDDVTDQVCHANETLLELFSDELLPE
jgi:hypothetical protein